MVLLAAVGVCSIGALHAVGHGDDVSSDLVNCGVMLLVLPMW